MKKRLLRVTGIFLAMSMLTVRCNASGGDDGEESASNEKVTLTIEASQEIMNNIPYAFSEDNIAAFEEEYPEIEVELVLNPDAQNTSILQTKLASGQPSDLICYNKVSAENELGIQKNCIDLLWIIFWTRTYLQLRTEKYTDLRLQSRQAVWELFITRLCLRKKG